MGAAGVAAPTDIYNEASFCQYQTGTGSGTVSFEIVATDLDANSTGSIQFASHPTVPATANASGSYAVTTPSYACKAGASKNLVVKEVRDAGTPHAFQSGTTY